MIDISDDKIYMEFSINSQNYVAFSDDNDEEIDMMFAKVMYEDGVKLLKSIKNKLEYKRVVSEFAKRLELFSENI